jgi:hypothetical protein
MTAVTAVQQRIRGAFTVAVLLCAAVGARAETANEVLQQLNDFPHAQALDFSESQVRDYEVGLGAMRKVGGAWTFKRSERVDGLLTRYTWQIVDGFTSLEVLDELEATLQERSKAELLFGCDGRACGPGVQWANRVFHQRLLYGREELQRYRVYAIGDEPFDLLLVYSGARSADRQYLHAELLEVTGD